MAKFRQIVNSLIAGEVSPTAQARTDLPQLRHACRTLQNMIPMISGGAYRRPGTLFDRVFDELTNSYPRLIPFVVSQREAYVLALYYDHDTSSGAMAAYRATDTFNRSTASTVVVGTGGQDFHVAHFVDTNIDYDEVDDIQFAQSVDVMWLVHPSRKPKKVTRDATDQFTIAPFDTGLTGAALRDAWPYRNQNTTAITLSINTATVGTGRVVTASAAFFDAAHVGAYFKLDSNGTGTIGAFRVTAFTNSTTVTVEVIVAIDSTAASLLWWESAWSDYRGWPRTVAIFQQRLMFGGNASERDSIWCSETGDFAQMSKEALIVANSPGDGTTTGPLGSDPFTIVLSSQQLNEIQWMSPDKTLGVGTLGDEFIVQILDPTANVSGAPVGFAAGNVEATAESHQGSSHHMAVRFGNELAFALASDDEIRAITFNEREDSFVDEPVQLLFDQYPKRDKAIKRRKYRHYAWDQSRNTLWCVDTAGNLFGMTRNRTLGVSMWHTHQLGGYDASIIGSDLQFDQSGNGDDGIRVGANVPDLPAGSVMSLAVVPNPDLGINDIWLTVKRKMDGVWVYHVERFMGRGVQSETIASPLLARDGAYFVDCAAYAVNAFVSGDPDPEAVTPIASGGFDHLENVPVIGTADRAAVLALDEDSRGIFKLASTTPTDNAGTIEISITAPLPPDYETAGYNLAFGLPFTPIVAPVRMEAGSQVGTAQAAPKRIHELSVRFYRTISAKVGASEDLLEAVEFRDGTTPMDESPELFSGDKTVDFQGDYDRDGLIYITSDEPLPFAVIGIVAEGQTYDG